MPNRLKKLLPGSCYSKGYIPANHQTTQQTIARHCLFRQMDQPLACSMHTDTVKGVTGAVAESERGVRLALLVQGKCECNCPLPLIWIGHLTVQLECI